MNIALLKQLVQIQAASGNEKPMFDFLLQHIENEKHTWKQQPVLYFGDEYQDNLVVVLGKPQTAIFAHLDSVGFTVRYDNKIVPIGGPEVENGYELVGEDSQGKIETKMVYDESNHYLAVDFQRPIDRGTNLTFKSNFVDNEEFVQTCYLDDRLGILNCLEILPELENVMVFFTTYEEVGGGAIPLLLNKIYPKHPFKYALISDITWITEGVQPGKGVVISMRDKNVPRKSFIDTICSLAKDSQISFQLEVEASGSSDGREIHHSPYPIDWVFIGAAEENVHSPFEKVNKKDFESMKLMYKYLVKKLI